MRWMDLEGYRPPAEYLRRDEPEPEKKEEDFSFLDALSAGIGTAEEHFGALTGMENFANEGRAIKERNLHQYEDNSIPYHLQNIFVALPESAGIMAASTAAGIPLGGLPGAAGGFARGALTQIPRIGGLIYDLQKAYQGAGVASKIARAVIPQNAKIATSAELGAAMEAGVEGYEAERRFIDLAKRNGTYVQGQTEQQAREVRDNVFWDNMGIISAFNLPQYNALMGRPARGLLGNVGRTVASGFGEGTEEVAQELASAYELGVTPQWRDIRDSFIAGGVMGTGMHGAGTAARYGYDRLTGAPTTAEIEEALNARKERLKEYSDRVGRVTVNDDGTAAYDNTPYGDIRQTVRDSAENSARQSVHGIDAFMRAIGGQESGGDYDAVNYAAGEMRGKFQIDVNNWAQWAQDAGLSPDAPMTPENQELVARNKMLEYYNKYGNWRDVASMWYSGYPISDLTEEEYTRPQYAGGKEYPSIKGYVDSIMSRFQEQGGEESSGRARGGNVFGVENYDMPTQGDNITQQVSQLKNGWSDVIPQIGGVLKEKFGLNATISSAARSADHNAAVGGAPNSYHIVRDEGGDALDIVFDRDTTQEEQDRIADYFKGTGLFSEVLYHDVGSGAHLHLGGLKTENLSRDVQFDSRTLTRPSETRRTQHNQLSQEETPKPLFDINAEDEQTQKLLERFASERIQSLANAENPDGNELRFFTGLFNDAGEFQNTEANRAALRERYGDEITSWANEIIKQESPAQPAAPTRTQSSPKPQGKAKVTNEDILAATDNFLERLRTDRTNPNTLLELQEARRAGDVAKMESILRQNNVEIAPVESTAPVAPSPQPPVQSENVVQNNQPPENILTSEQETAEPQQEPKPSKPKNDKAQSHIKRVLNATNLANKSPAQLKNIVQSIQWLAAQNGIIIPPEDLVKLNKHNPKAITNWRDKLTSAGALEVTETPQTKPQTSPQQTAQQPPAETTATPKETPLQTALRRAREILDTQEYTPNTHPLLETQQRQNTEQDVFDLIPTTEGDTTTDESESPTRESGAVEEPVVNPTLEDKRLAERRQWADAQREIEKKEAEQKAQEEEQARREALSPDIANALAPASQNKTARQRQGEGILNLINSTPFRNMYGVISLPRGLDISLRNGDRRGIEVAQRIIQDRTGVSSQELAEREETAQSEREAAEARRNEPSEQEKLDAERRADRRRRDVRDEQADEQALIAQEEDIARRAAQSQNATDTAQQGLMASTNETVQNQREAQQENVTRQEQPAQEDDRDVFDLLPESNELNNVESTERTEQRPPREIPQPSPQQAEPTQETQSESQSETPAQTETPKPKAKRSKKAAALHKKFKTDTHPNIGAYLDDLIETAKSTDPVFKYMRQRALNELKQYESMAPPTDEQLARVEAIRGIQAWIEEGRYMPVHEVATAIRNRLISGEISIEQAQQQIEELKKLEPELRNKLKETEKLAREKHEYFSDVGFMMEQEADLRKQFLGQKGDNVAKPDDKSATQSEPKSESGKKPTEAPAAEEKTAQGSKPQETETQKENSKQEKRKQIIQKLKDDLAQILDLDNHPNLKEYLYRGIDLALQKLEAENLKRLREWCDSQITEAKGIRDKGKIEEWEERAKERLPKPQPKPQTDTQKTAPADKGVGNWHTVAEAKDFSSLRSKIAYAFDDETIRITAEDEVLGDKEGLLFGYIVREVDGGVQFGFYDKNNNASEREVKRICEQMDRDIRSRYGQRHSQAREKAFSKLSRARRIVSAMESGELTPAEAYAEMEYFLKTGKLHANFTKGKADITGAPNIDTSNVVAEKDLTPAQKLLVSFGKKLGVEVVFFNNPDERFRGVHKGGKTFLNINGNKELGGVFWHESFHWLKNNNPELYKALVKAAGITDAQRRAYLETSKRTDLKSNEEIDEEILADMMDDVAKRTGLFQSIAGKNRGLIERVIQWFKDTLNKFIDHFRNPQGKLTTAQAQALASEFGRIANQLKDPNGNQIFRYNRRTHNVELANNRERTEAELAEMTEKSEPFIPKYSVDSNDNSTKSFKQRVKNLLGIEGKNIPIHKQMKRQLEDLSDMKIAADHLPEGVQVKIDKIAGVIRTGREYDWANILPEVGNAVAEQLGITQSAEMGNYIGKFILNGAPNDTSAEAKEFAKAMRENTEMRNKVMAIRGTFDTWNNMSAEEQMIASTRYDKEIPPLRERAQKFWQYLRTELFDTQMPIHYHVAKFAKATGIKLSESINPEIAFRNLRGMQQRAMRMVFGNEFTIEALQKMYPNVDFSGWKPMAMILEKAKAEPGSQRYMLLDQFVKACHFLDIHKHNDNVLMQQGKIRGEIRNLRAELDKADTKKKKAELERSIRKKEESLEALNQKIMDTPDAYTKDKCADLVSKYSDEFGEAQKDLVRYSRALLDIWVDSGMMDRRRYHQLLAAYPNYVPLHREFDENPNLNTADSMKQMLGSTKDVKDAIAAIANNTFDYIQRTEKNKAKLLLANLANFDGVGGIFELVDGSSPNDGTIIHFYENGKRKALQCSDEDIVKAVNSMNQPTMNLFLKVLQVPALLLRTMATARSPGFILGNFLRDPQDAFMVSKSYRAGTKMELLKDFAKSLNPFVTWSYLLHAVGAGKLLDNKYVKKFDSKALEEYLKKFDSKMLEEYRVSGAAQSDFFSFDRDYKAEAIERLTKKNLTRYASPKGVFEFLRKAGEITELATRLYVYDRVKTDRAKKHGGINIYDDLVTAAFESRDFIDFARHGNAGRTWNTLTAFANPVLQGFDKQWRTYDFGQLKVFGGTEETQKNFCNSVARLFLKGILPALVLALLHKDEDWYKDDVQDWEKENYWIISEGLRVPKGADLGLRFFSNLFEHLIASDPVRADKVLQPLKGILPDLMPTAFLPIFECMANYDLFRRQPIVPQREVNKFKDTPELQYDSTNSKLAVLLGRVTGVSPRYIDHVIYGYTSGFGKEATHLIDTVTPGRHGAWTRSDVPFFSRILRTPYRAPKIVSEYYEEFGRQESYAQRLAWEKKHGNPNAKPSKEYDPALHRRLKNIQRAMQNLNAAERAIMDDPKLTSEQVEEKREEIQKRRVELCRKAFQRAQ